MKRHQDAVEMSVWRIQRYLGHVAAKYPLSTPVKAHPEPKNGPRKAPNSCFSRRYAVTPQCVVICLVPANHAQERAVHPCRKMHQGAVCRCVQMCMHNPSSERPHFTPCLDRPAAALAPRHCEILYETMYGVLSTEYCAHSQCRRMRHPRRCDGGQGMLEKR
jgi:hypothetical protein